MFSFCRMMSQRTIFLLFPYASHRHLRSLIYSMFETIDAAAMAVTAPTYVLEESLSNQKLWKHTAGNRPPQPLEERGTFQTSIILNNQALTLTSMCFPFCSLF